LQYKVKGAMESVVNPVDTMNRPLGATRLWLHMRGFFATAWLLWFVPAHADPSADFNDYRGRVVYLDFWASWCTPCRQSFPWMQAMKDAYERQGLTIIAVNLDRRREDADKFLARFHPNFAVRFDPEGQLAERYRVQGMPTSVIIDRRGVQRYAHIGFRPVDLGAYESELRNILAEK
jgi:cytochrome c biogenesis protein CcmG, thiol:disulfide interchange protein DsbE